MRSLYILPKLGLLSCVVLLAGNCQLAAKEYHVALTGNDANPGSKGAPFRTIQKAAETAQPGDVITVHEGTYREQVRPTRGGSSDKQRIVYQAARGEKVEIKGSEPVKGWTRVQGDVWKAVVPNSLFGNFNPYRDEIKGDWFNGKGRVHHTGAVYLNGEWLIEATSLEEVLAPDGPPPAWMNRSGDYLLNVAWVQPGTRRPGFEPARRPADAFAKQQGVQTSPCSEGGQCIGFIEEGDWVTYEGLEFGAGAQTLEIRGASATQGGIIEIHEGTPQGPLLGTVKVPNTGGWQSWTTFTARLKPVSGTKTISLLFKPLRETKANVNMANTALWFAAVDDLNTTIHAQFKNADPNKETVEINVRQSVFYPSRPGCNYITVRGFGLRHAATPWAPPTAEQMGLIGTHWSKGWIIENNVVSHSICSGVALGKYGDQYDNTSANTAEGYVKTIERAHENGWTRENIGHHIVRNNKISHCEQTGIVGSLGSAFCVVENNEIHDIHVRRLFTGAEMAGIKFHAAIDTVIRNNHIYRTVLGLWLDWMAQGTRVSANLFHDNDRDLFMEVNHGPFLIDNNLFLSDYSLLDMSEGGAYVHNLFNGRLNSAPEPRRDTPYHPAHTTKVAGLAKTTGGDSRFYNNIFVGRGTAQGSQATDFGLATYNPREFPLFTGGNVYYNGARPYAKETGQVDSTSDPKLKLLREDDRYQLQIELGNIINKAPTVLVTTELLDKAKVPQVGYENPDGTPLKIDRDYLGKSRNPKKPTPGPFEKAGNSVTVRR